MISMARSQPVERQRIGRERRENCSAEQNEHHIEHGKSLQIEALHISLRPIKVPLGMGTGSIRIS